MTGRRGSTGENVKKWETVERSTRGTHSYQPWQTIAPQWLHYYVLCACVCFVWEGRGLDNWPNDFSWGVGGTTMTANTIKLLPGFTLLINSTSLQDAVHSDRQQLCFILPCAHEYGYIHYTSYYTDTMGTPYMGINFFLWGWQKEKGKKKKGWLHNPVACQYSEQNRDVPRWLRRFVSGADAVF